MRTRKIARPAITLKVIQIGGVWHWRIVFDHNGEYAAKSQEGFPTQKAATDAGRTEFYRVMSP